MSVLVLVFLLTIFVLPGLPLAAMLFPEAERFERLLWSVSLGLALSVYLAFASGYVGLSYLPALWALLLIALIAYALRPGRPAVCATSWRREHVQLVLVLVLVAFTRFSVAHYHELPPGWDPSFHLILARKIFESRHMIFDWHPFEDVALNYPVGSHVLIATLAQYSGVPLHQVFNYLLPIGAVVTTAQLFLFAKIVTGDGAIGAYAALAYGLWANFGSLDYYRWGGLPNLLGMILLLALLALLARGRYDRLSLVTFSVTLTSIVFIHHHVALTSLAILTGLSVYLLCTRQTRPRVLFIAKGLAGSLLLGSFYFVPYLWKALEIHRTGVLRFTEIPFGLPQIVGSLGTVFWPGLLGLLIVVCRWQACRFSPVFWSGVITLAVLFVVFEYVYRFYSQRYLGGDYVAFTPSRFLTDFVYFWCIFGGLGFAFAERRLSAQGFGRFSTSLPFVFALSLGLSNVWVWVWLRDAGSTVDSGIVRGFEWIDRNMPPDTIVLNTDPWATYLSWRRCAGTPLPVSEPSASGTHKEALLADLMNGRRPEELRSVPVVEVSRGTSSGRRFRVLWREPSGAEVREVMFDY